MNLFQVPPQLTTGMADDSFQFSAAKSIAVKLPFNTKVVNGKRGNELTFRARIRTPADAQEWLDAYKNITATHWVVSRTYRSLQKLIYRKDYVCHRSAFGRTNPGIIEQTGVRKNDRGISKNCACPASMKLKIYMESSREHFAKVHHSTLCTMIWSRVTNWFRHSTKLLESTEKLIIITQNLGLWLWSRQVANAR